MSKPDIGEIVSFGGDTAVHASAGTGKTHLLVEKFLSVVASEAEKGFVSVERVLAITFTDKAADEMLRRISHGLRARALALEETMAQTGNRAAAPLARHLAAARRRLSQAHVSTIHSFCARILRENPIEAGIDPRFEIMDQRRSSALMAESLGRFLLDKVRAGDAATLDLAYRYGFARRGEFENSLFSAVSRLLPLMRAAGMDAEGLLGEYHRFVPGAAELLAERFAEARRLFAVAAPAANSDKAKEMAADIGSALYEIESVCERDPAEGLRRTKRAASLVNAGFIKKASAELKELRGALEDAGKILAALCSREAAGDLALLTGEFRRYYDHSVKNAAVLDFDDLQEFALRMLRRNGTLCQAYRQKFRSIMVDEFQDVNRLQMELLSLLAPPGEGKLFIVGDPKQAIYGFRGGDVEVFDEAKRAILANGGKVFTLNENRRSNVELVAFANDFFAGQGANIFGADDACTAFHPPAGGPAVEVLSFPPGSCADDSRWMEAGAIASRMARMAGDGAAHYGDMVVLLRKFTALPLYEAVFRAFGIPFNVHKGAGFYESQEIVDLISVLSYIDDPLDSVAWAASLRSPLCGCADDTLLALRRGADGALVAAGAADPSVVADPLEREKYRRFMEWTSRLRGRKDRMLPSEILEWVFAESGIAGILGAQPNGLQKTANAQKLIEVARDMESSGTATLKNFVREMAAAAEGGADEAQAVAAGSDRRAVTVMTVHQGKGLEFPVVFLADIDSMGGGFPSPVEFHPRHGMGIKYVDKGTLSSTTGTVYEQLKKLNAQKQADDAMRLFYVACTRAERRLVLSGAPYKGNFSSGFAARVEKIRGEKPRHFAASAPFDGKIPAFRPAPSAYDVLRGLPPDGRPLPEEGPRGAQKDHMAVTVKRVTSFLRCPREYFIEGLYGSPPPGLQKPKHGKGDGSSPEEGTAVHALLERMDIGVSEKEWRRSAAELAKTALAGLKPAARNAALKYVNALHGSGILSELRAKKAADYREVPFWLKHPAGGRDAIVAGKIDLLAHTSDGGVYILDYKFSADEPDDATKMQLKIYALAVARETGAREITCALLYLKKPEFPRWEENSATLKAAGRELEDTLIRLAEFEDHAARAPEEFARRPVECRKTYCRFRSYCGF